MSTLLVWGRRNRAALAGTTIKEVTRRCAA
jgi:hypothetical protein